MFNEKKFNAVLAMEGLSKSKFAEILGISYDSLNRRVKNDGNFNIGELKTMVELFGFENVKAIFFEDTVA